MNSLLTVFPYSRNKILVDGNPKPRTIKGLYDIANRNENVRLVFGNESVQRRFEDYVRMKKENAPRVFYA